MVETVLGRAHPTVDVKVVESNGNRLEIASQVEGPSDTGLIEDVCKTAKVEGTVVAELKIGELAMDQGQGDELPSAANEGDGQECHEIGFTTRFEGVEDAK